MSMENLPSSENEPISLTREEFSILAFRGKDNPETQRIMKEKGIEVDSGDRELSVEGGRLRMRTDEDEFGTVISNRNR